MRMGYVSILYGKDNASTYISLLNNGMPYTEAVSSIENSEKISVGSLVMQTLGLSEITPFSFVGNQVPYFNDVSYEDIEHDERSIVALNPFELNDSSIVRYSQEENREGAVVLKAYNPDLKKSLDSSKPEVLIYHSHTTEYYAPATKDTTDERYSVVGVGNVLTQELEENYGIATTHDKTIHSVSYDDSYTRSGEAVQRYLNSYKDYKIIIDLHRDAGSENTISKVSLNGEDVSKIMFVTAENNPHFQKNQALTEKINSLSKDLFPGLSRGIKTYKRGKNAFNQNLSPNVILIEMGFNTNNIEEVKTSAKYVARLLAEVINGN